MIIGLDEPCPFVNDSRGTGPGRCLRRVICPTAMPAMMPMRVVVRKRSVDAGAPAITGLSPGVGWPAWRPPIPRRVCGQLTGSLETLIGAPE